MYGTQEKKINDARLCSLNEFFKGNKIKIKIASLARVTILSVLDGFFGSWFKL